MSDNQVTETKKNRKWVVRAMIAFVAILALLTFFSNTIMNMTIPKVLGARAVRNNLSYTNSATGSLEVANKTDIKGIDGRTVDQVIMSNWDYVEEGDVILTLKPLETTTELTNLQTQLRDLERERDFAARTPSTPEDYTALREAVTSAEESVTQAQQTLNDARNKDAIIAEANNTLNEYNPQEISLAAEVEAASATLEDLNAQISAIDSQIANYEDQITTLINLGVPTPTPVPEPGTDVVPEATEPAAEPSASEGEDPAEATPTAAPTAAPTENASTARIGELQAQIEDLQGQKELLESQLADAQARLDEKSQALASVRQIIADAEATLEAANQLPTVSSAQSALNIANSNLTSARNTLTTTQATDAIARDREANTNSDRLEQIADLEEQIAELEAKLNQTELKATASGYVYNLNSSANDALTADQIVCTIIPVDAECTATFTFSASVAQSLQPGMTLSCDAYWVDTCRILTIKPDSTNPREYRQVKCEIVTSWQVNPGESITVVADRSNSDYEHVIASSAVNDDNTGTFVYVIVESSSPLGDKYTVKRVDVTVEATDGALSAISGNGLDEGQIVIRSEEPLHDGDRVRLEDYSNK